MKSEITLNESVKEAIEIALIKLLMKKDINKITITELTEFAGVFSATKSPRPLPDKGPSFLSPSKYSL